MRVSMLVWGVTMVLLCSVMGGSAPLVEIKAEPAPDIEALFRRDKGWIGADGDYSVPLGKDRLLWLFSDTFVGKVRDGHRADCTMINNSVAIQDLTGGGAVEFHYRKAADGSPRSFITPDKGVGYFWLFGGVRTSAGLYLFMPRIENTGGGGAFGFSGIGTTLAHVSNPDDPPLDWKITQRGLPFARHDDGDSLSFGSAILKEGGYVYIYGVDSGNRAMILARSPEAGLGEFSAWRFYSGGRWQENWTGCEGLFPGIASEFSVSYVRSLKQYACVYTLGGIFGVIVVRFAPKPEGPWGEPLTVYECPDAKWHEKAFSYAAKAHPDLSTRPDELIVSYATNSNRFEDLLEDARLYWPRFVRLRFSAR